MQDRKRKLLVTLAVVGVLGSLATYGTFSAFSASTVNTGNSFAAGTVAIGDNDGGPSAPVAMFNNIIDQKPGVGVERCIKVTYSGSLPADVKLFMTTTPHASASNINLKIEKGTTTVEPTFPSCGLAGNFVAQGSALYDSTLSGFAAKNDYTSGVAACPGSSCDPTAANSWTSASGVLVYRFTMSFADSGAGAQSGSTEFKWEARNE